MIVWVIVILGVFLYLCFGHIPPPKQQIQKTRTISDNPIDLTGKTWFELEQYYKKFLDIGWYGQLQNVERARANILFREKRWHDCVVHELERSYLAIQGTGFSMNYSFDNTPKSVCFTKKDWDNHCMVEFCMFGNFGRAIIHAKFSEKQLVDLFLNSRYRGLPYNTPREDCVKYIRKCYREFKQQTIMTNNDK